MMLSLGDALSRRTFSACATSAGLPRGRLAERDRARAAIAPGAMLLFLLASPVLGQTGLNLSWDDCGAFGSSAKVFACNTNAGSNTLVASFAAQPGLCLIGCLGLLDLQTSGAVLPDWWQFKNAGSCRQTALRASGDFGTGPSSCLDTWQQEAVPGVYAYEVGVGNPNRARITVAQVSPFECRPLPGEVESYAFKLIVSNDKSVGDGACAGCDEGVCIVFNFLHLAQYSGFPAFDLTAPLNRNFVTWQAGIPDCPGATPVRNQTWGAVKTMYR